MSISRLPLSAPTALRRTCTRCFSSIPRRQDDTLLNILSSSPAARTPTPSLTPERSSNNTTTSSLASRLGREAGLNRANTQTSEILESERRANFQKQIHRHWQPGDVYAPHDLSGTEQKKWKYGRKKPQEDAFDVLGVNPILEYKNYTMMSEYMTETGRIKHSNDTGLKPKNQRKVAKAIRRAIGLGLMPSVHRHPLVLKKSSPGRFSI